MFYVEWIEWKWTHILWQWLWYNRSVFQINNLSHEIFMKTSISFTKRKISWPLLVSFSYDSFLAQSSFGAIHLAHISIQVECYISEWNIGGFSRVAPSSGGSRISRIFYKKTGWKLKEIGPGSMRPSYQCHEYLTATRSF